MDMYPLQYYTNAEVCGIIQSKNRDFYIWSLLVLVHAGQVWNHANQLKARTMNYWLFCFASFFPTTLPHRRTRNLGGCVSGTRRNSCASVQYNTMDLPICQAAA